MDLDYVSDALAEWIKEQRRIAAETNDYCRDGYAWRMASRGFNSAITLHMLFGEPGASDRAERNAVIAGAIYTANYCMERYIKLFGAEENKSRKAYDESEMVTVVVPDDEDVEGTGEEEMSEEDLAAKVLAFYQRGVDGRGIDKTAQEFGINREKVRYILKKAGKDDGDESSGV